jgi:hypothetical protein
MEFNKITCPEKSQQPRISSRGDQLNLQTSASHNDHNFNRSKCNIVITTRGISKQLNLESSLPRSVRCFSECTGSEILWIYVLSLGQKIPSPTNTLMLMIQF